MATPVACARPQPPWVRIDVCLDGAVSTRVRLPAGVVGSARQPSIPAWPTTRPTSPTPVGPNPPPPMPSSNRYLPPLNREPGTEPRSEPPRGGSSRGERVTVTRAAAQRGREMGSRMYSMGHRAATADGADKSGLTALTWPVVANFATDAAMAVALANTLFFAAATGESKDKVALYLLITIAPF